MEEYLNSIKDEIGYVCTHYTWKVYTYLEIHTSELSEMELTRIKTILKAWSFIGAPDKELRSVYTFMVWDMTIAEDIRIYGLKELVK